MLAGLREVLDPAIDAGTGVGAFNVICLEHAEGVIWGAEAANLPVVLQVSENAVLYHRSLEPILIATVALARNADIPAVVHLDHVTDPDLVRAGVELGATSVMFDGSRRSYQENVAVTADVVRYCHARNVQVEAELGEVGGKDGVHSSTARTRPEDATVFVDDTEVDALAVAVGSSHAMTERTTKLDLDLVRAPAAGGGGPAGAARILGGARRRADPGHPRRADQDQHRHPPERHADSLGTAEPGRPTPAGGSAPLPRTRPRRRGHRGRAAAPAAGCHPALAVAGYFVVDGRSRSELRGHSLMAAKRSSAS